MTAVRQARKTLLRKHITKEGAVVQTSRPAKYKDCMEEDDNSHDLGLIQMSEGS